MAIKRPRIFDDVFGVLVFLFYVIACGECLCDTLRGACNTHRVFAGRENKFEFNLRRNETVPNRKLFHLVMTFFALIIMNGGCRKNLNSLKERNHSI